MEKDYLKAGQIASKALKFAQKLIKIDASLLEVTEQVEAKIDSLGGDLAFPVQISRNEIAAHYCAKFEDKTTFKEGDLVCVDVGVHVNGYIGDNALTVDLGTNEELLKASRDALEAALNLVKPGVKIGELGKAIQGKITSYDYAPVRNLSGHGLNNFDIHTKPSIPNFDSGSEEVLKKGQVVAIEPFASSGKGVVQESGEADVFQLEGEKPVRNAITRKVLKEMKGYQGLPFAKRWLVRKFGEGRVNFALRNLDQLDILRKYPPLVDKFGLVSQAEQTIIVKEKPIITTKANL